MASRTDRPDKRPRPHDMRTLDFYFNPEYQAHSFRSRPRSRTIYLDFCKAKRPVGRPRKTIKVNPSRKLVDYSSSSSASENETDEAANVPNPLRKMYSRAQKKSIQGIMV